MQASPTRALALNPGAPAPFRARATSRFRFLRAYATTFLVIGSYLAASLGRRLLGDTWYQHQLRECHVRNARRVERTILALQGLFIKVGQLLSIMANFLPEEFRAGLASLQDQVPPRPFDEIEARIRLELGASSAELFDRFETRPIASASLGQVHEAWLKDGTHVVVKVQHHDIEEISRLDLKVIRRILGIVSFFFPIQGLDAYYHQLRELVARELDFSLEARNIARISANFAHDPRVIFPRVIAELSTSRVMTETFVAGTKIGDVAALDAQGVDRKELARRLVRTFCQMVFVDGVYHADPHPGNLLVGPKGEIVFIDFGAVAEVSREMREGMPEFLEGVIRRDTERLMRALRQMGFLASGQDEETTERIIEYFHQRFQEEVKLESFHLDAIKIDPQKGIENLLDLRKMNITLGELSSAFHVPRDWVLLQRTFLLLTGVCTELDGRLNPVEVVRPYLQEFVLGNRDWTAIALEAGKDMVLQAVTLPADLRKYLRRSMRGELEVGVRGLHDSVGLVYQGLRQIIYTALSIALGLGAVELRIHGEPQLARYCGWGAGGLLTLLLLSLLFTRTSARR
jgi:predicted unusual protein kinase regulating ubiquinone biosynthesis (AarF/ABC1/UbiB family)